MNLFQIKSFIKYQLKARYRKGYGLHSPFVFNLVREVIYGKDHFYAFDEINQSRAKLVASSQVIDVVDYGAGSKGLNAKQRKVADLARHSSIRTKYGELLFRIVNEFNPQLILELGTSIGISTAYLSSSDKQRKVTTIEGCPETSKVASVLLRELSCNSVKQITGHFKDVLPEHLAQHNKLDFVFFDGHHKKEATLDYFYTCLAKAHNETIFVFDDIHWSKGMEEAWHKICSHPQVTVSLDLFQLGIVFFRKECHKQHFIVRY